MIVPIQPMEWNSFEWFDWHDEAVAIGMCHCISSFSVKMELVGKITGPVVLLMDKMNQNICSDWIRSHCYESSSALGKKNP